MLTIFFFSFAFFILFLQTHFSPDIYTERTHCLPATLKYKYGYFSFTLECFYAGSNLHNDSHICTTIFICTHIKWLMCIHVVASSYVILLCVMSISM